MKDSRKLENLIAYDMVALTHNEMLLKEAEKIINELNKSYEGTTTYTYIKIGNQTIKLKPDEHVELIQYSITEIAKEKARIK